VTSRLAPSRVEPRVAVVALARAAARGYTVPRVVLSGGFTMRAVAPLRGLVAVGAFVVAMGLGGCSGSRGAEPCCWPPPASECGEAWCRVHVPPQYRTCNELVVKCPARCDEHWIPPVKDHVSDIVMVQPPTVQRRKVPAEWACVTERFLARPAKTEWKVDCVEDWCGRRQEVWRMCVTPAKLETRRRMVCLRPESFEEVCVPARYKTVCRPVVARPGWCQEYPVPAEVCSVPRTRMVSPGEWVWRRNRNCEVPACPPQPCVAPCPPAPCAAPCAPAAAPCAPPSAPCAPPAMAPAAAAPCAPPGA
jgi:hypothetical protein